MKNNKQITVLNVEINIKGFYENSYISLTDIARHKNFEAPKDVVKNWMRSKNTIEFLGLWEHLHNPDFKGVEFDSFRNEAGGNAFVLSPQKWIASTNAIGIISKSGRYGGTYAHQDIAFEFASWISAEFKLYLLKEFQRLKQNEFESKKLEWNTTRILSKINYKIHTEAIKQNLIPKKLSNDKHSFVYASEADLLNLALFGITAQNWREKNPEKKGNIRDYASIEQLIVLTNLESFNAELIKQNIPPEERIITLNKIAIEQLQIIINTNSVKALTE
ncbi:MAG: KilA-N domain-containing protein [Candidatus Cloacimonadota bacterium]|nr:KilA-N domain-containing protein [Candidatus Cloacimonadota bacterium]